MGAESRSGGAGATKIVCDRVGWDARGAVAGGGGVVAVRTARWKDVSAEEHDYLSGFLLDRRDSGGAGVDAAMANSTAGIVGTGPHEG